MIFVDNEQAKVGHRQQTELRANVPLTAYIMTISVAYTVIKN